MEAPARGIALNGAARALGAIRSEGPGRQVARFSWHFVQMAIAMEIGMLRPL
jgi:hypothetical protein